MFERVVQAWNGKWHIWEADTGIRPATEKGAWGGPGQPDRPEALTLCGESILVKKKMYEYPVERHPRTGRWIRARLTWCNRCSRVLDHRITDKLEELNNG